jgi:hypothetical protein
MAVRTAGFVLICVLACCGGGRAHGQACCLPDDGGCMDLIAPICKAFGGVSYEDFTCDDQPCAGACCMSDGSCEDGVAAAACESIGGTWGGPATDCTTVACETTGACCFGDGFDCAILTSEECEIDFFPGDGVWHGAGTTCETITCDMHPLGACCIPGGLCVPAIGLDDCTDGTYMGDGTFCEPGAVCCPWDVTGANDTPDAEINSMDFFDLLQHWGACPPGDCVWDFNRNGVVDTDDFFMMLRAWGPCA